MRTEVLSYQKMFTLECESVYASCERMITDKDARDKETLENIVKNHDDVLNNLSKEGEKKLKEIESLMLEKSTLETEVGKLNNAFKELADSIEQANIKTSHSDKEIEELRKQLLEKDAEKEKAIKEATDRLNREHKAEIENIRSRFKLMTMEKSPSETNLEKSGDFSSLPSHTSLLVQMTENFEMDKERAVTEALKKEKAHWEERIKELEANFAFDKEDLIQNVSRKVTEEKDKQIEILMEREKNLNLECAKYKSTIQQLAETNTESYDSALLEKINKLQKEKDMLEQEIDRLKVEKVVDMTTSVAVCEGKT